MVPVTCGRQPVRLTWMAPATVGVSPLVQDAVHRLIRFGESGGVRAVQAPQRLATAP